MMTMDSRFYPLQLGGLRLLFFLDFWFLLFSQYSCLVMFIMWIYNKNKTIMIIVRTSLKKISKETQPRKKAKKEKAAKRRIGHWHFPFWCDIFCNFSDGVFIGVGFMLCDNNTIAFTIVGMTLYHEIAQEIADYFILTRHCGFTYKQALLLNFTTGLSVVLGGILVLAVGMSDMSIGVLLAFATGTFINIAACECLPRVNSVSTTAKDKLLLLALFTCGAVPIGLTLLNHVHCD
mmetsp:Transcript_14799/g.18036  ORF Transcript_14799/g.18036 Transcript_14799/m.18036 type:complete len:234 (-) Transcript_14799:231-932(-)